MSTETVLTNDEIYSLGMSHDVNGPYSFARAIEQAVLQSPEIQALRKDAERYRCLIDHAEIGPGNVFNAWWLHDHGNPSTLDEALDIAIKEQP